MKGFEWVIGMGILMWYVGGLTMVGDYMIGMLILFVVLIIIDFIDCFRDNSIKHGHKKVKK